MGLGLNSLTESAIAAFLVADSATTDEETAAAGALTAAGGAAATPFVDHEAMSFDDGNAKVPSNFSLVASALNDATGLAVTGLNSNFKSAKGFEGLKTEEIEAVDTIVDVEGAAGTGAGP